MEEFFASWDEVRIEIVYGPVEVEDGLLIAGNVTYMRGRKGSEVQPRSAWLITIRNGEQTSLTTYQTKQEALEAGTRWRRSSPPRSLISGRASAQAQADRLKVSGRLSQESDSR